MKAPEIVFTYFNTIGSDGDRVDQYLNLIVNGGTIPGDEKRIKDLSDHYVLLNRQTEDDIHICPIHEIFLKDLQNDIKDFDKYFTQYIQKYGKTIVDSFIVEDEYYIKKKIMKLLDFAFDKVYPNANIISVIFNSYIRNTPIMQAVIHTTLSEYSTIESQKTHMELHTVKIYRKKIKEEENNNEN